jgi:hypothetical protein
MLATFGVGSAHAEPADNSLLVYAVKILQGAEQYTAGDGVYLGSGLVISASHVAGPNRPGVRIAGSNVPAKMIKRGEFPQLDLTLLSIDEEKLPISLRLRRMPLCQRPPWVGQPVINAIPEGTSRSHVISPLLVPPFYRSKFWSVISDVETSGKSGSGVFDAQRNCLLGILSAKITNNNPKKDIGTYFVPASTISAFIPEQYRF